MLDWYTVIAGLVALIALTLHGANYVVLKTSGELNARARKAAAALWPALLAITILSLAATLYIRPSLAANYQRLPFLYADPTFWWPLPSLPCGAWGEKEMSAAPSSPPART